MPRLRVLIIEDCDLMAAALEQLLMDAGADVVGAVGSKASALRVLAKSSVDVVSLDINLGIESGFAIADVLAARGIPFVFVTTHSASKLPDAFRDRPLVDKMNVCDELLAACHMASRRGSPASLSDGREPG